MLDHLDIGYVRRQPISLPSGKVPTQNTAVDVKMPPGFHRTAFAPKRRAGSAEAEPCAVITYR
ncbi:MAG: hypothetical protein KDF61_07745 [Rhodocyclaceae bacterium]|nr:hypothetical protein [Rhodocyclaceae bacterium]